MSPVVPTLRTADAAEWDEVYRDCPYSTFFHSRAWAEVWCSDESGAMRPVPKLAEFADGHRAVLPLVARKRAPGLGDVVFSSAAGTYGGWISADSLTDDQHAALATHLCTAYADIEWRRNPFAPVCGPDPTVGGDHWSTDDTDDSHVFDLSGGYSTIEERWARGKGAVARKVRRAVRDGLRVRQAVTRQDWEQYFAIYEDTLRQRGETSTSTYDRSLFERVFTRCAADTRLWLVESADDAKREEIVAGALCFYASRHAVYWHGAKLQTALPSRPINLLMAEILRHACDMGYRWFDLNPSGGHAGVREFKRQLGAEPRTAPVFTRRSGRTRLLRSVAQGVRAVTTRSGRR